MTTLKYNLVEMGGEANLTLFVDGEMYVASNTHVNWGAILQGVTVDKDPAVTKLFDVARGVSEKFERLGNSRATVMAGRVFFDGDELNNTLTQEVVRFLNAGVDDWKPLVKFLDKVMQNPQEHSREQLYTWMSRRDFTINDDGDIIGYKGVTLPDSDGLYRSLTAGTATVNGVTHNGTIPQKVGDVVEMPRSQVAFNPRESCSTGLHVANYEYANSFGPATLTVSVNPRDVVSVPTDSSFSKVRVCRYEVTGVAEKELQDVVISKPKVFDVTKALRIPAGQPGAGRFARKEDVTGLSAAYLGRDDTLDDEDYCEDCGEEVVGCVCDEDDEDGNIY